MLHACMSVPSMEVKMGRRDGRRRGQGVGDNEPFVNIKYNLFNLAAVNNSGCYDEVDPVAGGGGTGGRRVGCNYTLRDELVDKIIESNWLLIDNWVCFFTSQL